MVRKVSTLLLLSQLALWAGSETLFKGQAVGAPAISYHQDNFHINGYLQYLPIFEYAKTTGRFNYTFDIAGNFMTNFESDPEAKLYRLKFALANNQSEFRIGLQKINFGPARVLRSLQWFDRMSPTDLLKLTDGVYGALFTHYFLNNNNIWLWSLYGNDKMKGMEFIPTKNNSFEFGGRSQLQVLEGEVGLTVHHRQLADDEENKFALDGRWDFLVGSWFESVLQKSRNYQMFIATLGIDYTFGIGNGLYIMGEYMVTDLTNDSQNFNQTTQFTALMATYPFTLFDTFNAITYYAWETGEFSQYLGWQRTYDNFIFNINLFHYPESVNATALQNYAGYGIEFKLIYNH